MVKKEKLLLFYVINVIKDAGGRMARDERIFKSPVEVCQISMVLFIYLRNNRIKIKCNVGRRALYTLKIPRSKQAIRQKANGEYRWPKCLSK